MDSFILRYRCRRDAFERLRLVRRDLLLGEDDLVLGEDDLLFERLGMVEYCHSIFFLHLYPLATSYLTSLSPSQNFCFSRIVVFSLSLSLSPLPLPATSSTLNPRAAFDRQSCFSFVILLFANANDNVHIFESLAFPIDGAMFLHRDAMIVESIAIHLFTPARRFPHVVVLPIFVEE